MSWKKVKLGEVCRIEKGTTGILKAIPGEYPMVVTSEERKSHNEYQFDDEAVIIPLVSGTGHGHASIKRIHFQSGKFALGSILCAVIPKDKKKLSAEYLYRFLDLNKENELVARMKGMANVTLPMKEIAQIEIPLPSLKEQFNFVESYKALESNSEVLATELIHQLSLVKKLRQQLLQDAVQGKLVPQDKNDEPASELLKKIKVEKAKLILTKKTKEEYPLHNKSKLNPPFILPENWKWVRFWDIAWCFRGHNPSKIHFVKQPKDGYVRFIQITDFKTDDQAVFVPITKQLKYVNKGEIIMAAYRHIGKFSMTMEGAFNVALCKINNIEPFDRNFLAIVIKSELITGELLAASERGHIPSMHSEHLLSLWVPVPPLTEQHRIIAKLEELMQTCDELEASINASKGQNEQLLQQVLREALKGDKCE